MKNTLTSLTLIIVCFLTLTPASVQAAIKYDPFAISESPNNIAEQNPNDPSRLTADMWDYGQCDENCEKWLSQSVLTCGNSYIMESYAEGDQGILDQFAPSELGGDGKTERSVTKVSNYAHDACVQAQLQDNEAKLTADWPRGNNRYSGQVGLSNVCAEANSATEYTPNACAAYGTNLGNYPYNINNLSTITNNRPVVALIDINHEGALPDAYKAANPLILRVTSFNKNSKTDFTQAGATLARIASAINPNTIFVFGNELNNPEAEKYCATPSGTKGAPEWKESVIKELTQCGQQYVGQFNNFYTGVKSVNNSIGVAPAALDLIQSTDNPDSPGYSAEHFFNGAQAAYTRPGIVTAANIYCQPGTDISSCISSSDLGFGFYPQADQRIITEFGPNPPNVSVAEQVTFIEDSCAAATSAASVVTPLIVDNCSSGGSWLYYVNGQLFDQNGSPQTATCSMSDTDQLTNKALGSLYDFHLGSKQDKLYMPLMQARWAVEAPCKDIIRTQEEGEAYCDINPHCTNPSLICLEEDNCRSNYEVCKDVYRAMGVGPDFKLPTNQRMNAKNWNAMSSELRKEVNLITETKANVRGFIVIAQDKEFTPSKWPWGILGKRQNLPIKIVDLVLPGIEGSSHSAEADVQNTTLPQIYNQVRSQTVKDAGKIYPPVCPASCELIPESVCNSLDDLVGEENGRPDEVYTQEDINFYKRLINRICSAPESLSCEGAVNTEQTTGAKVNSRPNKLSIIEQLRFFIKKAGDSFQVPEEQPTTRMWFIADEATHNLGGYAQAYLDGFSMPAQTKGIGNESSYANPYEGVAEAETDKVSRPTQVACDSATDPNCPAGGYYTETEEAFIGFRERYEPKFDTIGANETTEHHETEGVPNARLALWWQGDRSVQSGSSFADEVGCKIPRVAAILGFTPKGCRSSATTGLVGSTNRTHSNYVCDPANNPPAPAGSLPGIATPLTAEGKISFDLVDFTQAGKTCDTQGIINWVKAPGRFPNSQIDRYLDRVIAAANNAGINPAFVISLWIEESGASDYQDLCHLGAVADFGVTTRVAQRFDFDSQLQAFIRTFNNYQSGNEMFACRYNPSNPSSSFTFEDFAILYAEGTCTGANRANVAAGIFKNNPQFPGNLKRVYEVINGYCR